MAARSLVDGRRARRSLLPAAPPVVTLLLALLVAVLAIVPATGARAAGYEIDDFLAGPVNSADIEDDSDPSTFFPTAGGRPPFAIVAFRLTTDGNGEPAAATRNVRVDIPPGLIPNPQALPTCSDAQLAAQQCPADTQVGVLRMTVRATIKPILLIDLGRRTVNVRLPIYNMQLHGDQVARFSINPAQAPGSSLLEGELHPIDIVGGMRASDNGLFFTIDGIPQALSAVEARLVFWGVPGAVGHDAERTQARTEIPGVTDIPIVGPIIQAAVAQPTGGNQPASDRTTAFLSNPTACEGPQQVDLSLESYAGDVRDRRYTTPIGVEGCDRVPFAPSTVFGGSVTRDSPAALDVGLRVPQSQRADTIASSQVRRVAVTLPPGFSISPSAANGLETCADAQLARGTSDPVGCPAGSRIGSATISTPLLAGPLSGSLYLGEQRPGDRYRLFLAAEAPGVILRLTGSVVPDPATGQLTAVFDDNPQLPFSALDLHFDGGPRAVLASPQTCGTATASTSYGPWSGTPDATVPFSIAVTGCDGFPFSPGFNATIGSGQSGASAPFTAGFTRADGNQYLGAMNVTLPPGLIAKLKGVPQCSEAQIAQQACPAASQLGVANTTAGPGSAPYALSGPVYFTGGYKGAPFGMVAIIHVVAGPYDLGNVVVRQAIRIDPNDAHVTVVSDPLPQILEGIPLRIRALALSINRAGFMRNPTSCGTGPVSTELSSAAGATARGSVGLSFAGCRSLAFKPSLKLSFGIRSQMKQFKHPSVTAVLTQKEGEAGIKGTTVTLPKSVALAADNAGGLCATADALKDRCPKASIVGSAKAETPILGRPLSGPAYFVKGERTDPKTGRVIPTLPTLFVPLRGEATIYLRATTAVVKDRLVTTFPGIPDAPISKFTLKINGGKKGIIAANKNLCAGSSLKGDVELSGHNGAAKQQKLTVGRACGASPKLRLRKPRQSGGTLKVSGTVVKAAKKKVKVSVVCGKTHLKASAKPKRGRWSAKVRLRKSCAKGRMAKVKATYPGDGKRRPTTTSARKLRLR